jgi:hypothetical protein
MDERNKTKVVRIEDLLLCVERDEIVPPTASFDPEEYENPREFICKEVHTLKHLPS